MPPNLHPYRAFLIPVALSLVISTAQANDNVTFASWMATFDFSVFPGADLSPTGDADADGIANAVEFVIGNIPNQTKVENLPTLTLVTNPGGIVPDGDYLKFSYRRSDASVNAEAVMEVAYHVTELDAPWSIADAGVDGVVQVEVENFGIPGYDIDVYIPRNSEAKFFTRLHVTVP